MFIDRGSKLFSISAAFDLISKVNLLRQFYDFSVTSWFRTEARNAAVGGLPKSLHLRGLAIDVVLDPGQSLKDFKADAEMLGLYVYNEGDHLHLYVTGQA